MKKVAVILGALAIMAALSTSTAFSADFLNSARGGGMGFSYFILADDPAGALYNPSALGYIRGWQTQLNYEKLNSYDYQIVKEKPYFGQFGLTYCYPQWGTFAINSLQSGSFSKLTNIPTFNHVALSYGRQLSPLWAVGGSMKFLSEWGFGNRSAFDLDLSVSLRTDMGIAGAFALENITHAAISPEYHGVKDHLPRRSRLGLGYFITSDQYQGALLLGGQMEESGINENMTTSIFNLGTEWWFLQNSPFSFAVRGGYTAGQAPRNDIKSNYSSPTAGLSLDHKIGTYDIRLDYAWQAYPFKTDDGSLPANHFVAVTFGWGGVPSYPVRVHEPAKRPVKNQEKPVVKTADAPKVKESPKKIEAIQETPAPKSLTKVPEKPASPIEQSAPAKPAAPIAKATPEKSVSPVVQSAPPKPVSPIIQSAPEKPVSSIVQSAPEKPASQKTQSAPPKPAAPKVETPKVAPPPTKVQATPQKPPIEIAQAPQTIESPRKAELVTEKPTENKNVMVETPEPEPFNVQMDVNEISSIDMKRVVFYVRPQQVIKSTSWKLFIFKAKIKDWNEDEAGRWALRVIDGKGVPPINVIWDGADSKGDLVSKGKYYFILTAFDAKGKYYVTDWFDFKLK